MLTKIKLSLRTALAYLSLLMVLLWFPTGIFAQASDYSSRVYYLYEVGNQIPLSDFNLGSTEFIKDTDGNGVGFSMVIKEGNKLKLEFDLGYSRTEYRGSVEDGVDITFEPQVGSGYETLSQSTNVVYDFNIEFQNPYLGLCVVAEIFRACGGRIFQSVEGDISISSSNIELATAEYETKSQLYGQAGFDLALDNIFFGVTIRAFEAPSLKITSCNEAALGALVCQRIQGATGNRNLRSNAFGEGVLYLGILF